MTDLRVKFQYLLLALVCLCGWLPAQTTEALSQTFHAPKVDVEQALKDLGAYQSGKLPFVDGFVGSIDLPLTAFQRPTYQYSIQVEQTSDADVVVRVNAKISAWYEDKDASKSGYQELPSSGRLEEDLLERLRGRLHQHAEEVAASREPLVSPKLLGTSPAIVASPSVPAAPAPAPAATPNFRQYAASASAKTAETEPAQDPRYERLVQEEKSLREVLAAQQRPDNLVAVKAAHTPVLASAAEESRVVMYAEAEDEFQFLKTQGEWTHVQIAGLNRGWIRSSQLERVGDAKAASVSPAAEPFRQTKEETSTFPGDWSLLKGKNVKIIWVQPNGKSTARTRLSYAETIFKKQAPELAKSAGVDGVVVVFDAAEGGMAATTVAALQQWGSGSLTDSAFLKQCWFDPADAFNKVH